MFDMTDEGFLRNQHEWNENVAIAIAELNALEITAAHWEMLLFMRDYYQTVKQLPNFRMFTKAVSLKFGTEKGNSRYLHQLFPQTPLKLICKIAGLPKPPTCL